MPAIQLQEATPDHSGLGLVAPGSAAAAGHRHSGSEWESAPPSPSPNAVSSFAADDSGASSSSPRSSGGAPVLPIHIPQTGDAAMQQFFHDIVGQLHTISLRNSLPPTPSASPAGTYISSFLDGGSASVVSTAPTTPAMPASSGGGNGGGGGGEGDNSRFEDAEDDESDVGMAFTSEYGMASSGLDLFRTGTPVSSIGSSSYRAGSPVLSVGGASSSHRRSADVTSIGASGTAPLARPRISVRASSRENGGGGAAGMGNTSPQRPQSRQTASYASYATAGTSADKENNHARFSASSGNGGAATNAGLGLSYPRGAGPGGPPPPLAPRPGQGGKPVLGREQQQRPALAARNDGASARPDTIFGDYEMVERPSLDEQMIADMMQPRLKKKKRASSFSSSRSAFGRSTRPERARTSLTDPRLALTPAASVSFAPIPSSRSGANDPTSPKQSWFAGLFNWKSLVRPPFLSSFSSS